MNEDIEEGVSIHWHGIDVPNREDGVAGVTQNAVRVGERYTYRFRAEQVGTFWYHSHEIAADEVKRGLYGALVIQPSDRSSGTLDLTAIVHSFRSAVVIGSSDGTERRTVRPGTPVRLRLVNSDSSAQSFSLSGTSVQRGGDRRHGSQWVRLRCATARSSWARVRATTLRSRCRKALCSSGSWGRRPRSCSTRQGRPGDAPPAEPGPTFDPAGYGSAAPRPFTASSHFDRSFEVEIGRKLGFLDGKPGNHWSVNGELYPHTPMYMVSVRRPREDDVQERLRRHASDAPARPPLPRADPGRRAVHGSPWWVDTLNVGSDETYEVGFRASNPGIWMFHCHNLPHARDGLTMHVMYGGVTTPYRVGDAVHNHPE